MKALGFPAAARLLTAADFQAAFAQRGVLRGRFLSVHRLVKTANDANLDSTRLGLVIGKRQCALANRRNLVKRLIREHFRLNRSLLQTGDFVFRLSTRLPTCSRPEFKNLLLADLSQIFSRLPHMQNGKL